MVMGMALKKPAAEVWPIVKGVFSLVFGEKLLTSF
jgi:hypothetical protein